MVDYQYKELFEQDSINKQISIVVDDVTITNEKVYAEAFELKESLCSENELRFGSCEASVLKLKIRNEFGALKGKWLDVSMILGGNADIPFQFGRYKVDSDNPSGDRKYTNITAYDAMYDIINAEMVEWYDGLEFPISVKDFRNSFFAHFGITQVEVTLIQDEVMIEKTIDADSISGKKIITAICELNGVFGHINRQGIFEYISLEQKMESELDYIKYDIPSNLYQSCEYEDFETQLISKLQIRQEENDIGAVYGDGTNCYIVEDNFLVYGKLSDELLEIGTRLFGEISGVRYRPFKAVAKGNPCYEVGDLINIQAKYKDIEGYVLERTLKGIQSLRDTFEAKGVYEYKEKVNSVHKEIKKLKGKTNVLVRTVEKMETTISDKEAGLQTQIKQTQDEILLEIGSVYYTRDDITNIVAELKASLELTDEGIRGEVQRLNKDLQDKFNLITKYFTFDINGLTIGQIDNPYKVIIDNDRYSMTLHDIEVLWIDATTGKVHTPEISITRKMNVLGYIEEMDEEGRINTRWAGDE